MADYEYLKNDPTGKLKMRIILIILLILLIDFGCSRENRFSIEFVDPAQIEITLEDGRKIFIDVAMPNTIKKFSKNDILLTTHLHGDHFDSNFESSFPGKKITFRDGVIERNDLEIKSIPSFHSSTENIKNSSVSNYIFILDIGDIRVVDFGDIGQDYFTENQLESLGHVDVAVLPIGSNCTEMNAINEKAFHLIDQIKPKIIIPTHYDESTLALVLSRYKTRFVEKKIIMRKSLLNEETPFFIVMGNKFKLFNSPD